MRSSAGLAATAVQRIAGSGFQSPPRRKTFLETSKSAKLINSPSSTKFPQNKLATIDSEQKLKPGKAQESVKPGELRTPEQSSIKVKPQIAEDPQTPRRGEGPPQMGIKVHSKELSKSIKKTPDTRAKRNVIYHAMNGA